MEVPFEEYFMKEIIGADYFVPFFPSGISPTMGEKLIVFLVPLKK